MRLIDGDALAEDCKRYLGTLNPDRDGKECTRIHWLIGVLANASTIEPERKAEELLPDGTLHLFTNTDLSKVDRVWVSQNGTHFGDLYYADGEPKIGKWIRETKHHKDSEQEFYYHEERCSECGTKRKIGWTEVRYCPMCGVRMVKEGENNGQAD